MYQSPHIDDAATMTVKAHDLFALADELFSMGRDVQIKVTGDSMVPFLHHGTDSVLLSKVPYEKIKTADIVLAVRGDGAYVLHRVFKKENDGFYMVGDAQDYLDGPYPKEKLVAKVTVLYRSGKPVDCRHLGYRFLARGWMLIRPWRMTVFAAYAWVFKRLPKSKRK